MNGIQIRLWKLIIFIKLFMSIVFFSKILIYIKRILSSKNKLNWDNIIHTINSNK